MSTHTLLENAMAAARTLSPISLEELDQVALLDRRDIKYIFHLSQLPDLLNELKDHYRILTIDESNATDYQSLYFDYPDFQFYIRHHNGRVNRYKVRYRRYIQSNLVFFEVKFKDARGWTSKERCKRKKIHHEINEKSLDFINERTNLDATLLQPKIYVNYTRLTLVSKAMNERLTIDLSLSYNWENNTRSYDNLVIMEVKIGSNLISPAVRVLKRYHIREYSISKYCIGIALIYPHLKRNNFKPKLLTLQKYKL